MKLGGMLALGKCLLELSDKEGKNIYSLPNVSMTWTAVMEVEAQRGQGEETELPTLGDALADVARAMLGPCSQGTLKGLPRGLQGDPRGSQGPQGARMLCQHPWAATPGKGEWVDIPPSPAFVPVAMSVQF